MRWVASPLGAAPGRFASLAQCRKAVKAPDFQLLQVPFTAVAGLE